LTGDQLAPLANANNQSHKLHLWLRTIASIIAVWLTLLLISTIYQSIAYQQDLRRYPPPGKLVDVGGYRLHLYCIGHGARGAPTVILEGGLGANSIIWRMVQPGMAEHLRVCSYDRAGYAWSDPGPSPRTASQLAAELHLLMHNSGESPPFVLVGHSFGGTIARLYASEYPEDVAGIVLVDPRHDDYFQRMPPEYLKTDQVNQSRARLLQWLTPIGTTRALGSLGLLDPYVHYLSPLPDDDEAVARALMIYSPQHWDTSVAERDFSEESYGEARASHLPVGLPLILLTAENGADAWQLPGQPPDQAARDTWMQLQEEQLALSENSQWIIVEDSGHYIYFDRPSAIIDAVLGLLDSID
jgi:pimeloyl-ACP methyl ester carboxylesterase